MKRAWRVACAALLISCGNRPAYFAPPAGSYSNVVLVTETGKLEGPTVEMVRVLQHELDYYTKNELQFKVRIVPASQFDKEIPAKNMVLFGIVNQGTIGGIIEQFIGPQGERGVLEGRYGLFNKMDSPVKGQLTLIVTAASNDDLVRLARTQAEVIRNIIEDGNRQRLREYLLRTENVDLERLLRDRYGFTVGVPNVYKLDEERPEVPGVSLIHPEPPRVLSVSWHAFSKEAVSLADSSELYKLRSDFSFKMYDKYVMRRDLVRFKETQLGPYQCVRMDGYWESSVEPAGGSFVCFFVPDRVKSRLWLIDCLVYAPGHDKHELVRELISVAETFRL
jgi:hypothetical protein